MVDLSNKLLAVLAVILSLASCGGGGGSPSPSACEQVSAGASTLTVRNNLSTGLEAHLPQFGFGAHMAAGECNSIGLEYSASSVDVRLELTQCTNSVANTDCTNKKFGTTKIQTIPLPRGESRTVTIDASTFM